MLAMALLSTRVPERNCNVCGGERVGEDSNGSGEKQIPHRLKSVRDDKNKVLMIAAPFDPGPVLKVRPFKAQVTPAFLSSLFSR